MRRTAAGLYLLCGLISPEAQAQDGVSAASSIERHWTSNVLDSTDAIPDWYTLLRGSLEESFGDADANTTLGAEFQATRHDTVSIEDDRALALSAQAFRRLSSGLELRGMLTYKVSSEGDNLAIGPFVLGMRTVKQVVGAAGQIGINLGNVTSLIIDIADSFEKVGDTHFEHDLLLPAQLDPGLTRAQMGARLTHAAGPLSFGISGSALRVSVDELGSPPVALSLSQYALRGEFTYTGADGSTLGLAIGGELLRDDDHLYRGLRPTWQVSLVKKLPHGMELRGTYFGRFETVDSDDPLASWLRRTELELSAALLEKLTVSAGIFAQAKENLLFENVEHTKGLYAELACEAAPSTTIVFRLDFARTFKTVIDERQSTVDAFIGLRAKI